MSKKFDIVLYGATGFTGKQTVHYFAKNAAKNLKWAIAGRSLKKLEQVKSELGSNFKDLPLIVADISDQDSIERMVSDTKVILTTVGPYDLYGEPVISACVKFNTDYVDITGETLFVKRIIEKYHQEAVAKGIKIIPFCGFDSVPSDLGTFLIVDYIRSELKQETKEVKAFFKASGGFNGGTLATFFDIWESGKANELEDPEILNPEELKHPAQKFPNDQQSFYFDSDLQVWTTPFFMAPINTRVVRRSNALFALEGCAYGEDFQYLERMYFDELLPIKSLLTSLGTAFFSKASANQFFLRNLKKYLPKPGEGPSEKTMDNGFFKTWFLGTTKNSQKVKAFIYSKGDPGNRVTVKILCESAFALVEQRSELPGGSQKGGILTPATGLGSVLIERLKKQGMIFEIKAFN